MERFKNRKKISTSSLLNYTYANLVFLLLFFFLLMTDMHKDSNKAQFHNLKTSQLTHLERKTLVTYIRILPAVDERGCRIQINDSYATVDEIYHYLVKERASLNNLDKDKMIISLRIDKNARMSLVNQVRDMLLKAGITKVDYRL